jgi:GNAT superfamily N-acetyltransferase
MCDDWMRGLQLELTAEQFRQLPRCSAFRYDYLKDTAYIAPRPRHYHALLRLKPFIADEVSGVSLRPVDLSDWPGLIALFAGAFYQVQPFAGLDDADRRRAAEQALTRTRSGGDGPWIEQASFVARDGDGELAGAILLTLVPDRDPTRWDSYRWLEPPPADCIERRRGRPHLTWIFVDPGFAGKGLGTMLLAAAVRELRALGYRELVSTFLLGNDASALWHWRNGFRLLAYPGSKRRRP